VTQLPSWKPKLMLLGSREFICSRCNSGKTRWRVCPSASKHHSARFTSIKFQSYLRFFRTIYEKLAKAVQAEDAVSIYEGKVAELKPSLRFCAYNIGDTTAAADLMQLRQEGHLGTAALMADIDVRETKVENQIGHLL
jgi:hypothetical protein